MIQRIQTIYMLLVALLGIALYYWFPALLDESGVALFERSEPLFLGLIGISIALSIIAIFLYKNRFPAETGKPMPLGGHCSC